MRRRRARSWSPRRRPTTRWRWPAAWPIWPRSGAVDTCWSSGPTAPQRPQVAGCLRQPARVRAERGVGGHPRRGGGIARHPAGRAAASRGHRPGDRPRQRGRPPGGPGGGGADVAASGAQPGRTRIFGGRCPGAAVARRQLPRGVCHSYAAAAGRRADDGAGSAARDERESRASSPRATSPARRACSVRVCPGCSPWTSGWRAASAAATCRCGRPRKCARPPSPGVAGAVGGPNRARERRRARPRGAVAARELPAAAQEPLVSLVVISHRVGGHLGGQSFAPPKTVLLNDPRRRLQPVAEHTHALVEGAYWGCRPAAPAPCRCAPRYEARPPAAPAAARCARSRPARAPARQSSRAGPPSDCSPG